MAVATAPAKTFLTVEGRSAPSAGRRRARRAGRFPHGFHFSRLADSATAGLAASARGGPPWPNPSSAILIARLLLWCGEVRPARKRMAAKRDYGVTSVTAVGVRGLRLLVDHRADVVEEAQDPGREGRRGRPELALLLERGEEAGGRAGRLVQLQVGDAQVEVGTGERVPLPGPSRGVARRPRA